MRLAQADGAVEIQITGIVQGVGFRPHVYKLATLIGLKGWVINTTAGVTVRLEGPMAGTRRFIEELFNAPPPLARIEGFTVSDVQPEGFATFFIRESRIAHNTEVSIPPDIGTCLDCLCEYNDLSDRRYGYAFTNCVNCGPRFSITHAIPYDRKNTSMYAFAMCEKCDAEYADPKNRRFHAEPNACPVCGPQVILTSRDGVPFAGDIRTLLKEGRVLAIKGIGSYHLACNAQNNSAVQLLRLRKRRHIKPFALMFRDLETVRLHCELSPEEEELLVSPERPIILLRQKSSSMLSMEIAPGLDTLGVMLPYTPLHYGLFDEDLPILVMTSANISGDPLILTEKEAYAELGTLAEVFVVHKRKIINRADDSVVMLFRGEGYFVRRARGYVPQGVMSPRTVTPTLAVGGDKKSVFAYAHGKKAILSQYFGDLSNLKNLKAYEDGIRFFGDFLRIAPQRLVCDLHPDYISASYAERYAKELGLPLIKVQHHKAHFASVMADNGLDEKVLGVVCDGTGYGDDGTIWGCEFFYGDYDGIERVGSLAPFPQPRGDGVVRYPLHMAAVLLYALWGNKGRVLIALPESNKLLPFAEAQAVSKALSIVSSSCGRIFDAAAALCGFTGRATYEGEAAMRMEALAHSVPDAEPYRYDIMDGDMLRLSWQFLSEMAEDKLHGTEPPVLAARFHSTISAALCEAIKRLSARYSADKVVFSGGTFQNRLVISMLAKRLPTAGIAPYFHRQVPTNDGGLALGQVMLATGGK